MAPFRYCRKPIFLGVRSRCRRCHTNCSTTTMEAFAALGRTKLRAELKMRGLSPSGLKGELMARLSEHLATPEGAQFGLTPLVDRAGGGRYVLIPSRRGHRTRLFIRSCSSGRSNGYFIHPVKALLSWSEPINTYCVRGLITPNLSPGRYNTYL